METSANKFEIIHETINKANNTLSVTMLCEIAGVSRSGYYNWVASKEKRIEKEEQDRADFELILIDDGSDDSSGLICDKYAEKDKRIIVVHQENKGICGARNAGLDIARGKYIGF